MATHPVFLPGESQGQGSLVGYRLWGRPVGHNWSDLAAAAARKKKKGETPRDGSFSPSLHPPRFFSLQSHLGKTMWAHSEKAAQRELSADIHPVNTGSQASSFQSGEKTNFCWRLCR